MYREQAYSGNEIGRSAQDNLDLQNAFAAKLWRFSPTSDNREKMLILLDLEKSYY